MTRRDDAQAQSLTLQPISVCSTMDRYTVERLVCRDSAFRCRCAKYECGVRCFFYFIRSCLSGCLADCVIATESRHVMLSVWRHTPSSSSRITKRSSCIIASLYSIVLLSALSYHSHMRTGVVARSEMQPFFFLTGAGVREL